MPQSFRFDRFEVRPAERALLIDGKPVELGSRAFDVLQALITHRDRVLTKDELLDMVWPGLVVEENNLQAQVSALRKLLGPKAIATIPGRGYQFVAGEEVLEALIPANAPMLSIVVLPFANLTGDVNQGYVADGMTANLTADLARIREVFVVNAATAFIYKDKTVNAQRVGQDLGVRFVLHGNVQRNGDKIRINAQLADATTNAQLWSESFEGDQSDLFTLQDKVTTRIGNSIGREMVIVAARESESRKSKPEVIDLMLRAMALNLKPMKLANLRQTEAWYRKVLVLDPNNANAMVELANSLAIQANNFTSDRSDSASKKKSVEARDFALRAKEIDPDNPGVYTALGIYAMFHDDYAGARRAAETRVLLDPKNPNTYNNLALSCIHGGEPKRAIELLTQAISLAPKHVGSSILANMGRAHFMLGENDAAIEWYLKALENAPGQTNHYFMLPIAYFLKGDDAKRLVALAELRRTNPKFKLTDWGKPLSSSPPAYKEWFEKAYLPAARKAGLPE